MGLGRVEIGSHVPYILYVPEFLLLKFVQLEFFSAFFTLKLARLILLVRMADMIAEIDRNGITKRIKSFRLDIK